MDRLYKAKEEYRINRIQEANYDLKIYRYGSDYKQNAWINHILLQSTEIH